MATDNVIPFPRRHKGDPEPRRFALATIGFRWCEGAWRRGRVVLSDADINAMEARRWARCLRRWTTRRPRARMNMFAAQRGAAANMARLDAHGPAPSPLEEPAHVAASPRHAAGPARDVPGRAGGFPSRHH